jgi:hypothetical protein
MLLFSDFFVKKNAGIRPDYAASTYNAAKPSHEWAICAQRANRLWVFVFLMQTQKRAA